MRTQPHRNLTLVFLIALVFCLQRANGQSRFLVRRDLVWSLPGEQILTPKFSPDGNFIVIVTRAYWPDGSDAAGLPDSFFKKLEDRAKTEPRFDDPVIKVIALSGHVVCEAQYGWNPSLSRDNKRIVFSEQVKPITGFRGLASPMSGNAIRMYDCGTKQLTRIADPHTGYLDAPFFSPDGESVVYTENEAVNGAFGGSVGISRIDLQQNRGVTLVNKKTVAAVPCPPVGSNQSRLEAFKCSQVKNLTSSFPQIVYDISPVGSVVVALLGTPIPAPGDMYMADNYDMTLVSVLPVQRTVLSLGKRKAESWDETTFQAASGEKVLIFSQYWKLFSLATGEPLPDVGPRNTKLKSVYSPDLKYYLCAETAEPGRDPDHFVLYRTADGKRLENLRKIAAAYGAVWSPESNRFATVGLPLASASAVNHREELIVYSLP